jgi:hypothetical protein
VDPQVAEQIRVLARERGESVGRVAGRFLEHGFRAGMADNAAGVVVPTLEHFLGSMLRGEFRRVMYFVARSLIETNALRRQVYLMHAEAGSTEQARRAFDRSYENAVKALKRRVPEATEVVAMLEALEARSSEGQGG